MAWADLSASWGPTSTTQRTFTSDDVHFLEAVANVLAGALERQRLDEQVRQGQKMQAIGTLAGGIAHDFNNILAAILGYTELASDDVPRDSMTWRNLQRVLTAAARARELVQQIMAFSRQSTRPAPACRTAPAGTRNALAVTCLTAFDD